MGGVCIQRKKQRQGAFTGRSSHPRPTPPKQPKAHFQGSRRPSRPRLKPLKPSKAQPAPSIESKRFQKKRKLLR